MTVTVYTSPGCQPCRLTTQRFDTKGVRYTSLPAADHREYLESLGYQQMPVVVAGDMKWSGFRVDKIKEVCDTVGS